jgi:hypothetical protein
MLRYVQHGSRGKRVWGGRRVFVGCGMKLEMGQGLELEGLVLEWVSGSVVGRGLVERWVEVRGATEAWRRVEEPEPYRSEGGPVHAERIRRSWGAVECEAMGPVVGFGEVASGEWRVTGDNSRARAGVGVEVGVIRTGRVGGRAGRGNRG